MDSETKVKELTEEQREEIASLSNDRLDDSVYLGYLEDLGVDDFSSFDEAYSGQFMNDEVFARDLAESTGSVDFKDQAWPNYCIDWEYAARDLMMDYTEIGGHYFRCL